MEGIWITMATVIPLTIILELLKPFFLYWGERWFGCLPAMDDKKHVLPAEIQNLPDPGG